MRPVERAEIVDYVTYQEARDGILERVMKLKIPRRVHLGRAPDASFSRITRPFASRSRR